MNIIKTIAGMAYLIVGNIRFKYLRLGRISLGYLKFRFLKLRFLELRFLKHELIKLCAVSLMAGLAISCSGTGEDPAPPTKKTFDVSLKNVVVTSSKDGKAVNVDVSSIKNEGLVYEK